MLRKAASTEGKDWDRLIPFLLFAYREVPHDSRGFSPFELLYGRDVRGPLDIIKESWCGEMKSNQNVVSYVSLMRERLERMAAEARENMETASGRQKSWYDRGARERTFQPGDQVLVLLPTSSSKLTAQWQGPYSVVKQVGKVNYLLKMHGRKKKSGIYHVNMLQKWHTVTATGFLAREVSEEQEDIPFWNDGDSSEATVGDSLTPVQLQELNDLLKK